MNNVFNILEKDCLQKASIDTLDELWTTIERDFYGLSDDYIKTFPVSTPTPESCFEESWISDKILTKLRKTPLSL